MTEEMIDKTYFVDPVLVEIIKDIERGVPKHPVNITLTVGGHLISGQIVSAKEWADEQFTSPRTEAEDDDSASRQETQNDSSVVEERRFIHLKNAKIFYGVVQMPDGEGGFYWRGKLIAVDGYMLQNIKLVENSK